MTVAIGTNSGFVSSVPSADPAGTAGSTDNYAIAQKDTSPLGSYLITSMGWWCDNATEAADYELGIYSHDATNNRPNALLASSGAIAKGTDAGWKTGAVAWDLVSETIYWVATQLDDTLTTTLNNYTPEVGQKFDYKLGETTLPASWGSSSGSLERAYAIYAFYGAAGGLSWSGAGTLTQSGAINRHFNITRGQSGAI